MPDARTTAARPAAATEAAASRGTSAAPLGEAYAACTRAARHYENFPVGSWLLPRRLRPAVHAVYAFARGADDFADEPEHQHHRLQALAEWEEMLREAAAGRAREPIFAALADTIRRHRLPLGPFVDLLEAFRMDARLRDFETWDDLLGYCRLSADPVGRLMLRLFGYEGSGVEAASDALCTALQLTNFWQDLGVDVRRGRFYLPAEDLRRFGLERSHLLSAATPVRPSASPLPSPASAGAREAQLDPLRDLLALEVERTRALYGAARALPLLLRPPLRWEVRAIAAGGERILERIERGGYDTLARRPSLGWSDRVWMAWAALAPAGLAPARPGAAPEGRP